MAIRDVCIMGNPILRKVAEPVKRSMFGTSELDSLINDMVDTMRDQNGVGLAAPQIGIGLRIAVIEYNPDLPLTVYINPKITTLNSGVEPQGYFEGCLSVPGIRGFVVRPQHVRVDYQDQQGNKHHIEPQGFNATIFQHEFDHLDGLLFLDKVEDTRTLAFEDEMQRQMEKNDAEAN